MIIKSVTIIFTYFPILLSKFFWFLIRRILLHSIHWISTISEKTSHWIEKLITNRAFNIMSIIYQIKSAKTILKKNFFLKSFTFIVCTDSFNIKARWYKPIFLNIQIILKRLYSKSVFVSNIYKRNSYLSLFIIKRGFKINLGFRTTTRKS